MRGVKVTGPRVTVQRQAKPRRFRPASPRRAPQPQVVVVEAPRRRFGRGPQPLQVQVPGDEQQPRERVPGGSTLFRCRRQLVPLTIPAALLTVSAALQAAVALGADRHRLTLGVLLTATLAALVAGKAGAGKLEPRWRPRVWAWAIVGPTWLIATTAHGLSLTAVALLVVATAAITSRWWAEHRHGYPTHPPRQPMPAGDVPPAEDDIVGNFTRYAACQGGPAEDCTLTDPDVTDARSAYTMRIRPGKDSLNRMLQRMDVLATAVHHQPSDIMLEQQTPPAGKRANPNLLRFTVITRSPVADGLAYTGPQWYEDGYDAWIEAGTYADGDGRVRIPVLAENSSWNMILIATMGAGKSTLLNAAAASARASGRCHLVYFDGQGGVSSPLLREYADWAPDHDTPAELKQTNHEVLAALEAFTRARHRQMKVEGIPGINTTRDRPFLLVIIDECHLVFDQGDKDAIARWDNLARQGRKYGLVIWAATQHPKLKSFGGEDSLRDALGGRTTLVGLLKSPVAAGILRTQFDPATLPKDTPGWWFIDAARGRSAMWRGEYLSDKRTAPGQRDSHADRELRRFPPVPLEDAALQRMPEFYRRRGEIAREQRERLLRGGDSHDQPAAPAQPAGAWRPQWPILRPVPSTGTATLPAGLTGRQQDVWTEVAAGRGSAVEIGEALDLAKTRVYDVLKELVDAGHVRAVDGARGRYEVTT
ncbi:MAG: hypothetical protein J2P24_08250 [Streptosporangiales bacterium]|nr:hypothetical protein [Streptosporangiales bacterium]